MKHYFNLKAFHIVTVRQIRLSLSKVCSVRQIRIYR